MSREKKMTPAVQELLKIDLVTSYEDDILPLFLRSLFLLFCTIGIVFSFKFYYKQYILKMSMFLAKETWNDMYE
jgi:hypothetical protein